LSTNKAASSHRQRAEQAFLVRRPHAPELTCRVSGGCTRLVRMTLAPEAVSERVASRRPAPYVGPVAFDEDDAPFFFGRPEEAASVSAKLRSARLTVLYGPSGVGKSSLLRAGVVPLLRDEAHQTQDESPFAV